FRRMVCLFFVQAEDGIRDRNVTGVQTCALPISGFGDHQDGCVSGIVVLSGDEVPLVARVRHCCWNRGQPTRYPGTVVVQQTGAATLRQQGECDLRQLRDTPPRTISAVRSGAETRAPPTGE